MSKVDQFESVFRAAERVLYRHEPVDISSVLVVTDMPSAEAEGFSGRVRGPILAQLGREDSSWKTVGQDDWSDVETLLAHVSAEKPDLVCTYRNLRTDAWKYPYSLGVYLDVLAQATPVPILVLPHPQSEHDFAECMAKPDHVMAITDHLTGDHRLVSYAATFTAAGGTLYLTHIEDENAFEHTMTAISKLPWIDTDEARVSLHKQLLKDPHDYVTSCSSVLAAAGLPIQVEEIVAFGHHLARYKSYVDHHAIDLLVMNTKDEDQLAMHGLAYPLAVELRQVPLLLL